MGWSFDQPISFRVPTRLALLCPISVKMSTISLAKPARKLRSSAIRVADLYKIRNCIAATGEHIPFLIDALSGLPLARPNTYILVMRRDRCQSSTLRSDLDDLAILYAWAKSCDIDLDLEMDSGRGLSQAQSKLAHRRSTNQLPLPFEREA